MLQGMMHVFQVVARLPRLKASGKDDISCSSSTSCNMVLHLLSEKENDVELLIFCNDDRAWRRLRHGKNGKKSIFNVLKFFSLNVYTLTFA